MVDCRWQTATERGVPGFNVLIVVDGGQVQRNESLIASLVIDAITPTDYLVSFKSSATTFYLQEVGINGNVVEHSPFNLSEEKGTDNDPEGTELAPTFWLTSVSLR